MDNDFDTDFSAATDNDDGNGDRRHRPGDRRAPRDRRGADRRRQARRDGDETPEAAHGEAADLLTDAERNFFRRRG